MRGEHPRRRAAVLVRCSTITTIAGAILLWGADVVAQTSPEVVFPTGDYPADVLNVQAAADRGGTVLLKATNLAGVPTAFNFGTPRRKESCGFQVALQGDVRLIGETAGPARTTITGGYRPILIGLTGWCGDYSPVSGRVLITGIDFERSEQSAIDIYKSSAVEIADTRISNVVETFGLATGINVFGGGSQRRITGSVVIRDNIIRYRAPDAGWSHAIVLDNVAADVDVTHNVVETTQAFSGILVVRQVEGTVRITDNFVAADRDVPGSQDAGIYIYANDRWNDIRTSAPRYEVVGNRIETEYGGIGLVGQRGSIDGPVITENHITTSGLLGLDEGIYFGGNVSNARVMNNRIEGAGAYGIDLFAFEPGQVAESNLFVGNDLTQFVADAADVFLDAHTASNTVVIGSSDTVIDSGIGNRILP